MAIDLSSVEKQALSALDQVGTLPDLDQWKSAHLGKKGPLSEMLKGLKDLAPEEKKAIGKQANEIKKSLQDKCDEKREKMEAEKIAAQLDAEWLDVTLPKGERGLGHQHPLSRFIAELEDVFTGMGFKILDGPLVEDDWHSFQALNIPPGHPARDMQDTFFTTDGAVLRPHTSSVQIRTMEKIEPPFRGVAPGRVFRCEEVDATHGHTFHQLEGLLIDREISVANMLYFLKTMLAEVFGEEVDVRLRHSYFPFVEPGFELDILQNGNWMELLGCGLVHPNVLEACKIDPDEWSGFAFGMGIERLVMKRFAIDDIRHFMSGDLRFIRQFN